MQKAIIALSAAGLFFATPVVAHSASSKAPAHQVKHRTTHSAYGYASRTTQAIAPKRGYYYSNAPTYASVRDIAEIATGAGGGDGGGGGGYRPSVTEAGSSPAAVNISGRPKDDGFNRAE